jgi:hypothetical protein
MSNADSVRDGDPVYWGDRLTAVSIQGASSQFEADIGWSDPFVVSFWLQVNGKYNPEYYTPRGEGPFDYREVGNVVSANGSLKIMRMWAQEEGGLAPNGKRWYHTGFSNHPTQLEILGGTLGSVNGDSLSYGDQAERYERIVDGEWHHWEAIWFNSPNMTRYRETSHAQASAMVDGRVRADRVVAAPGQYYYDNYPRTLATPIAWLRRIGHDPNPNYYISKTVKFHDIYVDNTLARVFISEDADYDGASESHIEMQLPVTWDYGEITFTLNFGSFVATNTVYVYVQDADGTFNTTGEAIVLE